MKRLLRYLKRRYPNFLPAIIYHFVRMLFGSVRITLVNAEIPRGFHQRNEGIIQIMWHGRLLAGTSAYQGKNGHILISSHGDGEIIARVTGLFGFSHVRGSSSKGGQKALKELVTLGRRNQDLVLTPDGPRGPAEEVKPGVAQVARLTGLPVIPFAYAASPAFRAKSWDRFLIPLPFARCFYVWGEPVYYREGEDIEEFRLRIQEGLSAVTRQADGCVGS